MIDLVIQVIGMLCLLFGAVGLAVLAFYDPCSAQEPMTTTPACLAPIDDEDDDREVLIDE